MSTTICPLCWQNFASKQRMESHLSANVCANQMKKKLAKTCQICGHVFCNKLTLEKHLKKTPCGLSQSQTEKKKIPKLKVKMVSKEKPLEEYNKKELISLVEKLKKADATQKSENVNITNINNGTINNNVQNIRIVFPSAFGKEDIEFICQRLGDILTPLAKHYTSNSIFQLFEKIHTNEKLPEYHNVYCSNVNSRIAYVSNGHRFQCRPKNAIIDQIIENKKDILENYIVKNAEKLTERVYQQYEKQRDLLDNKPELLNDLKLEIACSLANMKHIIENEENERIMLKQANNGYYELDLSFKNQ